MSNSNISQLQVPALPATVADLKWKSKRQRSIVDDVQDVMMSKLYGIDIDFMALINAVYNEESVEGAMIFDDARAAEMIRDAAPEGSTLAKKNVASIRKAMNTVLRRVGESRTERRNAAIVAASPAIEQ